MTDTQIIELLAEWMGWHKQFSSIANAYEWLDKNNLHVRWCDLFNPCTDWNHTHQVLDKVMEDEELWERFIVKIGVNWNRLETAKALMKANQRTLMEALVSILQND